jgi:hypothetical protein
MSDSIPPVIALHIHAPDLCGDVVDLSQGAAGDRLLSTIDDHIDVARP